MNRLARALRVLPLAVLATCNDSSVPTTTSEVTPVGAPVRSTTAFASPGRWDYAPGWPQHVAVHMHLLPNGQVLFWSGDDRAGKGHKMVQEAFIWNPQTGSAVSAPNSRTDVFCSGHAFLPDGRLLVVGGHIAVDTGLADVNIFDFGNRRWGKGAAMAGGRWYPSAVTLISGEVLVEGGADEGGKHNELPEVWQVRGGWRRLTGATRAVPYYPRMFALGDGRAYHAGPYGTEFVNVTGTGSREWGPSRLVNDRHYGSAVMYAPDKILYVGGGGPPTDTAEIIEFAGQGSPAWRATGSMTFARTQTNATLLADGTVLVTGGSSSAGWNTAAGAVRVPELWDPATGTWTQLAQMFENRLYHSTALLLPDARVLAAGGGRPPAYDDPHGDHRSAEIFTPPYLLTATGQPAARPVISSAPTSVGYDQAFTVGTPNPASIAKVTWIRTSSVTHAHNMDQRFTELVHAVSGSSSLRATAPPRRDAPPGYHMLIITDENGVPSVAKIIRIS